MKRSYSRNLKRSQDDWFDFSYDDMVYIAYFAHMGAYAIVVDHDEKDDIKTLHVFKAMDTASRYVGEKNGTCVIGKVRVGLLIEKLREVYSTELDCQVRCVLTQIEKDDKLYETDVLWQLFTN